MYLYLVIQNIQTKYIQTKSARSDFLMGTLFSTYSQTEYLLAMRLSHIPIKPSDLPLRIMAGVLFYFLYHRIAIEDAIQVQADFPVPD